MLDKDHILYLSISSHSFEVRASISNHKLLAYLIHWTDFFFVEAGCLTLTDSFTLHSTHRIACRITPLPSYTYALMLSKERGLDEVYQSELVLIIVSLPLVSVEPLATSLVCVLRILRLSL